MSNVRAVRSDRSARVLVLLVAAALVALALGAAPLHAQSLVNGSMDGAVTGTPWNGIAPAGWTNNGWGTTDIFDAGIGSHGYAWMPSTDGGTFVHASGITSPWFLGEEIWQTITDLVPGNTYEVSFEQTMSNATVGTMDSGGFWRVSVAGVVVDATPMVTPPLGVPMPWKVAKVQFVATDTEHVLHFAAQDDSGDLGDMKQALLGLDGVTVTCLDCGGWGGQGGGLPGLHGAPQLLATGTLGSGDPNVVDLQKAAEHALAALFIAPASQPVPFKGGTLLAFPSLPPLLLPTGDEGAITLAFDTPDGLPAGLEIWMQYAIQDPVAVQGVALSNAVRGVVP